jgi:hypothetical protein
MDKGKRPPEELMESFEDCDEVFDRELSDPGPLHKDNPEARAIADKLVKNIMDAMGYQNLKEATQDPEFHKRLSEEWSKDIPEDEDLSEEWSKDISLKLEIKSIEIRPGVVETYKVTINDDAVVVVDAETLSAFNKFNPACLAQAHRLFIPPECRWAALLDGPLRAAKPPENLSSEMICWHGSPEWKNNPRRWLIRERIPEQGVGLLSGSFSMFKSFQLIDASASVITGLPWLGAHVTRRGGVLIFAAEGANDIPMRMAAMVEHKLKHLKLKGADLFNSEGTDLEYLPFAYIPCCRPLMDPKTVNWMIEKAAAVQEKLKAQFGLDLVEIGIDTMSASAGWESESDAAQVQCVMNNLYEVSKASGAFVLAVDHFGKDQSQKSRGSSVKESSADMIMDILGEKQEDGTVYDTRLVLRKQRSGPEGMTFPFEARLVDMGLDQYGEPLTSRVINWNVKRPEKQTKTKTRSTLEDVMTETLSKSGEKVKVDEHTEVTAVRKDQVRFAFKTAYQDVHPGANSDAIGEAFRRALRQAGKAISEHTVDGVEWLVPCPI